MGQKNSYIPAELIKKKQRGEEHTRDELDFLVNGYSKGDLPDYQMSAWLMAVFFKGMTPEEISNLTEFMKNSGEVFDFSYLKEPRVDKHSTGGVGDKTSLILGPLAAACDLYVPMIAGRGLGHTGGTLDKFESIPGFNTQLSKEEFIENVEKHHFAMLSQTETICPADRKLYALRDVTGTVASLPLISGSIMSKKLAEDLTGLVLDVKFGSGAFMKSLEDAEQLARTLISIGERQNVKTVALLTSMEQPLGRFIGNGLEVKECLDILSNETCMANGIDYYESTRELSLKLTGYMLWLGQKADSATAGYEMALEKLKSGEGLKAFKKLCEYQGPGDLSKIAKAPHRQAVAAPRDGHIAGFNTEQVGIAALELGAGRKKTGDKIDFTAGIEMNGHIGLSVKKGDDLFFMESSTAKEFETASKILLESITWSDDPVPPKPLIAKTIE